MQGDQTHVTVFGPQNHRHRLPSKCREGKYKGTFEVVPVRWLCEETVAVILEDCHRLFWQNVCAVCSFRETEKQRVV